MTSSIDELTHARDAKHLATLDDATLVFTMLGLQGEPEDGRQLPATARYMRRMVFAEIADRWIPPQVTAAAFAQLFGDDDS
jgi:hypothetical protein